MKRKKKILILYANVGHGHLSASNATKAAIEELYGDKYDVETLDFLTLGSASFSKLFSKVYDKSVKYTPTFYKTFFDITSVSWPLKFFNQMNYPMLKSIMRKILKEQEPDLIVSTYPIWEYGICKLWKKERPDAKFINIITDSIYIHQAWLIADADYRIVPNEDTAQVLMEKGVPSNKIKLFGFPVGLDFAKPAKRDVTLKFLGLNPKLFTILLFANVGNDRKNVKIFEKIIYNNRDYNVVCVTGRNKTIMPKIEHLKKEKNVAVLGWTTNVPDLIKSSDLVITKAGGATVQECIAAVKPMIITQIILGQEEGNADLIETHQLGYILENGKKGLESIPELITEIRKNHKKYTTAIKKQSRPKAAYDIAKFLVKLVD